MAGTSISLLKLAMAAVIGFPYSGWSFEVKPSNGLGLETVELLDQGGWIYVDTNAYSESVNMMLLCCCLVAIHAAVLIAIWLPCFYIYLFLESPDFHCSGHCGGQQKLRVENGSVKGIISWSERSFFFLVFVGG